MKTGCRVSLAVALGTAWLPGVSQAQVLSEGLVFHAVAPCRAFDTRPTAGGPGPLAAGVPAHFAVMGDSGFAAQGGASGGCGIPDLAQAGGRYVQAVMLNFVAVNPAGPGNLRAWAGPEAAVPNASILNFTTATTIANGVIVPVSQLESTQQDIAVRADGSATNVLADVVGYFVRSDMGSRGACYGLFCGGSPLAAGHNFLWGDSLDTPDLTPAVPQDCLVTANLNLSGSSPGPGFAELHTALRNITDETDSADGAFGFPAHGDGDDLGSVSKTTRWHLSPDRAYRFGCHVHAGGSYVGDMAYCYVSWICH